MINISKNILTISCDRKLTTWEQMIIKNNGAKFDRNSNISINLNATSREAMTMYLERFAPQIKFAETEHNKLQRQKLYDYLRQYFIAVDNAINKSLMHLPFHSNMLVAQSEGAGWIMPRNFSIIGMQQGLGKTLTSLAGDVMYRSSNPAHSSGLTVYVSKAIGKYNLLEELAGWGISESKMVVLESKQYSPYVLQGKAYAFINYDILHKLYPLLLSANITSFAFDECHKFKNVKTQTFNGVWGLVEHHKRRQLKKIVLMSGTPIANWSDDMYAYVKVNGADMGVSVKKFRDRYLQRETNIFTGFSQVRGTQNDEELRDMFINVLYRRTHENANPDFKGINYNFRPLETAGVYDQVQKIWNSVTSYTSIAEAESRILAINRITSIAKAPETIKFAKELLAKGKKVVIFSFFIDTLKTIEEELSKTHETYKLVGSMTSKQKFEASYNFQNNNKPCVFIGQTLSAGESANLQSAHETIFNDLPLTWKDLEQAIFRTVRIGQKEIAQMYFMLCAGTCDEDIADIIIRKHGSSANIIDRGKMQFKSFDFSGVDLDIDI